uniref:RNase H type-1 domain-containing protein n=1 Tax=Cannabis sativa TaxID=3483 RepID=A0A803PAK8_CANSA
MELSAIKEPSDPPNAQWNPPPQGWIACNSDIGIGHSQASGAAVFRDTTGTILSVITFKSNHCDPLPGEISAILEGAAAAVKFGYKNVIFQSDSLNAVSALKTSATDIQNLHFNIQDKTISADGHSTD